MTAPLLSPPRRHKERFAFLQLVQSVRPEVLSTLHALLPTWRNLERPGREDAAATRALHNARGRLLYEWALEFNL